MLIIIALAAAFTALVTVRSVGLSPVAGTVTTTVTRWMRWFREHFILPPSPVDNSPSPFGQWDTSRNPRTALPNGGASMAWRNRSDWVRPPIVFFSSA